MTLLVIAVVVSGVALGTSWWTLTSTATESGFDGGETTTTALGFDPGTSPQISCTFQEESGISTSCDTTSSDTPTYTSEGLASLESYYILAQVSALLGVVLGLICAIFAIQGARHAFWGRWHFHLTHLLALSAFVLLLLAPTALMAAQPTVITPSTYASDQADALNGPINSCPNGDTPNSSFWNSCTYTEEDGISVTSTWGAGIGWYLAFVAAGLFVAAGMVLLSSQDDPEDDYEDGGMSGRSRTVRSAPSPMFGAQGGGYGADGGLPAWTSGGAAAGGGLPLSPQGSMVCPRCRKLNPPSAALCSRCHTPLS